MKHVRIVLRFFFPVVKIITFHFIKNLHSLKMVSSQLLLNGVYTDLIQIP